MSTDKLFDSNPEGQVAQGKRIPVASAHGGASARLNDQPMGKRKRVRITTSDAEEVVVPRRHLTNRFDKREQYANKQEGSSEALGGRENYQAYQERYQTQRAEGNYDYNYNKNERKAKPKTNKGSFAEQGDEASRKTSPKAKTKKSPAKAKKAKTEPVEPVRYPEELSPETQIRLNKYLANAGVCSRREADLLIERGEISVNGEVVTELGRRVTPIDVVKYKGERVESQSKVYILLNKPKNCVTTSDDPECRLTVMDLVKNACPERVYPVGRLDRQTTGVLLITNDGALAAKLTHPSFLKKKIYHVWLDKPVTMEHMQIIANGMELEDGEIHADALSYASEEDFSQVGIEIHSGRNRIVRRIFEHLGYRVRKLDRVYFAGLTKRNLRRGQWRYLDAQEVNMLRMGAFE